MKDLAEALDLSIATVSRALSGHERIALATRERVARAAQDLGYMPNRAARALVSGRSGFVGLVLPVRAHGAEDAFLGEFVSGLSTGLAAHGVDLFLGSVPEGKSELGVIENIVQTRRADGLVMVRTSEHDPRVAYLSRVGFPFVTYGRVLDAHAGHVWLDTDGTTAFGEAFDLLYGLGHRRFGFVTITEPMTFRHMRARGLMEAIARQGDPEVHLETVAAPRFDPVARETAIRALLDRPDRPTAIIGLFDGLALTVMEAAEDMGLAIPRDLSVTGFDNIAAAAHRQPGLTTFDSAIGICAKRIADMLTARIEGRDDAVKSELIRPEPVLRGSHGPVPNPT